MTFAEKIINFNNSLELKTVLPAGISIMNPYREEIVATVSAVFYNKFYNDENPRHLILGINPGRFGAGVTGIPFTDTKRLKEICEIEYPGKITHEPSSVFIYRMIEVYGGIEKFYSDFYIGAVCPLGFTSKTEKGREVNYNYYDSPELMNKVKAFIIKNLELQIDFGIKRDKCFILGCGKNEKFFRMINDEKKYFQQVVALEHPRFIMQYRLRRIDEFIEKYINALTNPPLP